MLAPQSEVTVDLPRELVPPHLHLDDLKHPGMIASVDRTRLPFEIMRALT